MSDTPPGNPQSRGGKPSPSRPGAQAASFLTHLSEVRKVDARLTEAAAVSVITALLQRLEPEETPETPDPLALKLLELLPLSLSAPVAATEAPEELFVCVSRAVGRDASEVEPLVRAVFQGLREYLSEAEAQEVERQLSWDLQHLWRRTQ
ncbi:DUF2267 domain-containing protein [Melittangium boletus]|uniref:DUF2267 domain-containing protein n=1 Tax=Melittangium boletus DSM 14713 TaxID=1294270 RepID=A0A250IE07_9BACT|nr:DUF2267 domain-containing protein [Melittangium boletus]ATB29357.1 hypothetical protein MEBOL_002806 [Melittangium boletus DSM 14713]